jgi:hypothetical protein
MTRQELLTRIRQMSDTMSASVDYPDALILDFASMVHIDEWRNVFGVAPYYRTQELALALDANGTFAWSALSTGTGDERKNAFRVLEITDDRGQPLSYAQADRVRLANNADDRMTTLRLWTRNGDRVQCFGVPDGGTVHVLVNWTPTPVGDLSADDVMVDWLDEWKPVLFYETAAMVLSKGGRETNETRELMQLAEKVRQRMLATLKREAGQPFVAGADDNPWEWGG